MQTFQLTLNLVTFINILAIFIFLFLKRNNTLPNKVLAYILLCPGINFISNVVTISGGFERFPYLFFIAQANALLFAPLVNWYANLLIGRKINKYHPMHFLTLVTILLSLYFMFDYLLMSPEQQADYRYSLVHEPYPWQQNIINSIFIVFQQIYFTHAAWIVYRQRKVLVNSQSNLDKTKIGYITIFVGFIWLLNLITLVLYIILPMSTVEYIALPIVLTIIYFFILYYAFQYHSLFTRESYQKFITENIPASRGYRLASGNRLPKTEISDINQRINTYLEQEEAFLNPDFTIDMLAKATSIPSTKISTAINSGMKKNFFDLVNEKRVERSKDILSEKVTTHTIESIAYDSGFNSRASFYRAFKKHTGITPTVFSKSLPRI
ncbi:MAG: helix-turn-helix domain-containing protein [Paludibacteraceae bacterium]